MMSEVPKLNSDQTSGASHYVNQLITIDACVNSELSGQHRVSDDSNRWERYLRQWSSRQLLKIYALRQKV